MCVYYIHRYTYICIYIYIYMCDVHRMTCYLVEVFTSADESQLGEWLAISSRINTWLFSLFRQTKQPSWNLNRPASPKFNLVFACGYIAKRQHRAPNLTRSIRSKLFIDICSYSRTSECLMWKMTSLNWKTTTTTATNVRKENRKGQKMQRVQNYLLTFHSKWITADKS